MGTLLRWWEFLTDEPREANTEGGVLPAIFGAAMRLLMVLVLAPFGGITALCLRDYAEQGKLASIVRMSVNLAERALELSQEPPLKAYAALCHRWPAPRAAC